MTSLRYTDCHETNVRLAAPYLPDGCRFIAEGETIPRRAKYVSFYGTVAKNNNAGEVYNARDYVPHFVKIAKPKLTKLDRIGDLEKEVKGLRAELKALKEGIRKAVG